MTLALKKDKGEFNGSCNRSACRTPGATWYNKGTYKFYCHHCAVLINRNCLPSDLLCSEDIRVHSVGFVKSK
jgi:hypothetical protein